MVDQVGSRISKDASAEGSSQIGISQFDGNVFLEKIVWVRPNDRKYFRKYSFFFNFDVE